jgi:pimeloyl-ACP methyl ester carboxylesterase
VLENPANHHRAVGFDLAQGTYPCTWVNDKNDERAPLLFISGSEDHLMPPSIQRSNAKHDKSSTVTEAG